MKEEVTEEECSACRKCKKLLTKLWCENMKVREDLVELGVYLDNIKMDLKDMQYKNVITTI
jgi:hypothetical protein